MKKIRGYDYRTGDESERSRAEWTREVRDALEHGGFRRVDHGETFIHGRDGTILFEVYDVIGKARCCA